MAADPIKLFKAKMDYWGIKGVELAQATGRTVQNISETRNGKTTPSVTDFVGLIEACDRLKPGFSEDYYTALSGKQLNLQQLINSLDSVELGMLLMIAGQRMQDRQPVSLMS